MSAPSHGSTEPWVPHVVFDWDPFWTSIIILVIAYGFIVSEKINRAVIALIGAGLMVGTGILNQHAAVQGVDFNTIALLVGMMTIVGVTKRSGVFQFVAIYAARAVKGNPRQLMVALAVVTAVFSAMLDNVTTVMLIIPITLLLTEQMKLPAYPFLFSQIFASNIGGTATLIGDPPNILIGSAVGLSFMDFVYNVGPAALVIQIVMLIVLDFIWGRKLETTEEARAHIIAMNPHEALTDKVLLVKSLSVMALALFGFIVGHGHGFEPGSVALFCAALLMLLDGLGFKPEEQSKRVHNALGTVEWETIFFFVGLFILVYGVETAGVLNWVAEKFLDLTQGSIPMTGLVIIWSSAVLSAIVDNIPFVATMIPLVKAMGPALGGGDALMPLWWCLSLGACLGGNGSLVGASANVIVASFAERAGQRISFLKFLKLGFPLMILTIILATIYAWFMFLAGL